ncbi:MAG: hypothetical protein AAFX99_00160 [Myxococcota bacterium]
MTSHLTSTLFRALLALSCSMTLLACGDDDDGGETSSNTTASNTTASNTTASNTTASNTTASNTTASNTTTDITIEGEWLSEGSNVAPLLAADPFNFTSIRVTFEATGYTVVSTDSAGTMATLEGSYITEAGVDGIMNITLQQSSPTQLVSTGIYQIDTTKTPAELRYEVVQTEPDIGITPPTAAAGFGSTGDGAFMDTNVQLYIRQ